MKLYARRVAVTGEAASRSSVSASNPIVIGVVILFLAPTLLVTEWASTMSHAVP